MTTQHTIRVKLKRVHALKQRDTIIPGKGLFRRDGTRIVSQAEMVEAWGPYAWSVQGTAWMNAVPEMNVSIRQDGDPATESILHTPLDAYVVLA